MRPSPALRTCSRLAPPYGRRTSLPPRCGSGTSTRADQATFVSSELTHVTWSRPAGSGSMPTTCAFVQRRSRALPDRRVDHHELGRPMLVFEGLVWLALAALVCHGRSTSCVSIGLPAVACRPRSARPCPPCLHGRPQGREEAIIRDRGAQPELARLLLHWSLHLGEDEGDPLPVQVRDQVLEHVAGGGVDVGQRFGRHDDP